MHQHTAVVRFLNEIGEHLFSDLEVRDHAVFHRFDSHHISGSAPEHFFSFATDRNHLAGIFVDGHDGRFVDDDPFSPRIHQRVGGTEIDGQVG